MKMAEQTRWSRPFQWVDQAAENEDSRPPIEALVPSAVEAVETTAKQPAWVVLASL